MPSEDKNAKSFSAFGISSLDLLLFLDYPGLER